MDPDLEMPPFGGDFSPRLLGEIGNALLPNVLPLYDVRIEEYLFVTRVAMAEPGHHVPMVVVDLEYPATEPTSHGRPRGAVQAIGYVRQARVESPTYPARFAKIVRKMRGPSPTCGLGTPPDSE